MDNIFRLACLVLDYGLCDLASVLSPVSSMPHPLVPSTFQPHRPWLTCGHYTCFLPLPPHLHMSFLLTLLLGASRNNLSWKPYQGIIQHTQEGSAYSATQLQNKSPRPSFTPACHPKDSCIQKFWSPPWPPELSSNVTFPSNHSLDTVPHSPSRTDHVILPLNTHLEPVPFFFLFFFFI